jgi:hypothetical protein
MLYNKTFDYYHRTTFYTPPPKCKCKSLPFY